ncbi:MAG: TetR/AcrR family transcriptional regulator [Ilumatobacteraceae bacterium]|jgi:AcrR family transcriptional regulator|nr:TetR/AcrR family transcriptional regulator [Ilumatobacteraceae bacterium]
MGRPRDDLLTSIVEEVAANGLADRSLRDIAEAVGSSHRMLLYHFGSHAGLVAAIVEHVEASQRAAMTAGATAATEPVEVVRSVWERTSAVETRPFVALFFEAVAYAARSGGADFTTPWIEEAAVTSRALGTELDPVEARIGTAVIRGLLIDVITTGDAGPATEALERFVSRWGPPAQA